MPTEPKVNQPWRVLGSAIAFGVQNAMHGAQGGRKGWIIDIAMLALACASNSVSGDRLINPGKLAPTKGYRLLLGFLVWANLWRFAQCAEAHDITLVEALDVLFRNSMCTAILFVIFPLSKRLNATGGILAMLVGFGICSSLNIVGDKFITRSETAFEESRFSFLGDRWIPPLSRSSVSLSFCTSVAVATCLATASRRIWTNCGGPAARAVGWIALATALWGTLKCQFRAQFMTLTAGLAYGLCPPFFRRLIMGGGLLLFLGVSPMFIGTLGYDVLDALKLDVILRRAGSKETGASDLSERSYLYRYGWDRMFTGQSGIIGDGPYLRDSWPGLGTQDFNQSLLVRHAFHNGLLDILVVYGLPLGGLVVVVFILQPWVAGFRNQGSKRLSESEQDQFYIGSAYLTMWLFMSAMDSGLSYGPEFFAIVFIPAQAALIAYKPAVVPLPIIRAASRSGEEGSAVLAGRASV